MIIDKIGAGHYQTRDGRPVVILCLDVPGTFPVVGYWVDKKEQAVPCFWMLNGLISNDAKYDLDLIPAKRKPREVWLYAGSVFEEGMDCKEDFLVSVKHTGSPGYVLFREVMEDE